MCCQDFYGPLTTELLVLRSTCDTVLVADNYRLPFFYVEKHMTPNLVEINLNKSIK